MAQARIGAGRFHLSMRPVNFAGLTRFELVLQARQEPRRSSAAAVLGSVVLWCSEFFATIPWMILSSAHYKGTE